MKKSKRRWNQKGFTLIESIITLVLVSIMAVMLLTFSQPLYSSLGAFTWFNDELLLQQKMEQILGDYKNQRNDPNPIPCRSPAGGGASHGVSAVTMNPTPGATA